MSALLRRFLSPAGVQRLRNVRRSLRSRLLRLAASSRLLSNITYLLREDFGREHQAVLKGKLAYQASLEQIGASCALLRRNVHRLEKGLIMRPRRSVFAEVFIEETVDCYAHAMRIGALAADEKKWATDVLSEYFSVVGASPVTERARRVFEAARLGAETPLRESDGAGPDLRRGQAFKPYPYEAIAKTDISFASLEALFLQRRSVRWYEDRIVPKVLVQQAADTASLAPSACNRQPYRFAFCGDKEKAVAIAKCAGGTGGFAENLPALVVLLGDLSAFPYERDRHLIYIDGSLAVMQFMLALETLGLSSCPINWPEDDLSERAVRQILPLKDHERIVMLLAVGYADRTGGIPFSQKKVRQQILEDIS